MQENQIIEKLKDGETLRMVMTKVYQGENTNEIAEATSYLKLFSQHIESVPIYFSVMTQSQDIAQRQLAAILIKKNIENNLKKMDANDINTFKTNLLQAYFNEQAKAVYQSIGVLVALLMKVCALNNSHWNDVIVAISQKSDAQNQLNVRLQSLQLLDIVLDITGEHLSHFYKELLTFMYQQLSDNAVEIKRYIMVCAFNLLVSLEDEVLINGFNEMYPTFLEIFVHALQDQDIEVCENFLDSVETLIIVRCTIFTPSNLEKLLQAFCHETALLSKEHHSSVREKMLGILQDVAAHFKESLLKNQTLQKRLIEISFTLACESVDEDELEDDEESVQTVALQLIRSLAKLFPKKKSYPVYKSYLEKMFASDRIEVIEGAFYILGNLAEGVGNFLKRELDSVIMPQYIENGIKHQNEKVRKATCYAIYHFAEYLHPEFLEYHEKIMPVLIENLDQKDNDLVANIGMAIELFCNEMEPSQLSPYVKTVVPKLIQVIGKDGVSLRAKNQCLLAVSACASVSGSEFAPISRELLPILQQFLTISDVQYLDIKSHSIHCVASILGNCLKESRDIYDQFIAPMIEPIFIALRDSDNTILKEFSLQFFYALALYLGSDFRIYMEEIIKITSEIIKNAKTHTAHTNNNFSLDSDSEDDDAGEVYVDKNVVEELNAAIHCLGEIAVACPVDFRPYLADTIQVLEHYSSHYEDTMRSECLVAYKNLAFSMVKAESNGQIPAFQKGMPIQHKFSNDTEQYIFTVFLEAVTHRILEDDSGEVVRNCFEVLEETVKDLGPASLYQRLEQIVECINKVLNNEAQCQINEFENEDDVDGQIFGAATALVEELARNYRDGFEEGFVLLADSLKKFCEETRDPDDTATIIGTIAICMKYIPNLSNKYGVDILKLCFAALEYGDEYVNTSISYCVGMIVENGAEIVNQYASAIFEKLKVIGEHSTYPNARDNILSTLARLVYCAPNSVPGKDIIALLMKEIPFKEDKKENRSVIRMIAFCYENDASVLAEYQEKIAEFIVYSFANRKQFKIKTDIMLKAIGFILNKISSTNEGKAIVEKYAAHLAQQDVQVLGQLLQQS